jgi:hypothetical protein
MDEDALIGMIWISSIFGHDAAPRLVAWLPVPRSPHHDAAVLFRVEGTELRQLFGLIRYDDDVDTPARACCTARTLVGGLWAAQVIRPPKF